MMWSDLNHFSKLFRCCVVWPCVTKNSSITDRSWTTVPLLLVNVYSAYLSPPGTRSDVICLIRVGLQRHEEAHHGCPTHLSHTLIDRNCTSSILPEVQSISEVETRPANMFHGHHDQLVDREVSPNYKTVLLYPQALN